MLGCARTGFISLMVVVAVGSSGLRASAEEVAVVDSDALLAPDAAESSSHAQNSKLIARGKDRFNNLIVGTTNQRACGTCHVEADALALSPATVQAARADSPLFNPIDADDPFATPLTYNNLKAGLVRITFELPENIDLVAIPPEASIFAAPEVSAQLLAAWEASIVPGAHLGDPMPPDLDLGDGQVIHFQPEIITPPDRKIFVWRGVPSVANTIYTAPYQFDGRESTLQAQALGALIAHSGFDLAATLETVSRGVQRDLDAIAAFEKSVFSDRERPAYIARQISRLGKYIDESAAPVVQDHKSDGLGCYQRAPGHGGVARKPCCDPNAPSLYCLAKIPDPEVVFRDAIVEHMPADQRASWDAGKVVYDQACAGCHGSATDNRIKDRAIHDGLFFDLDANGNVIFDAVDRGDGNVQYVPRRLVRPNVEFINLGTTFISHIGQLGGLPLFNSQNGVRLPRYRLRFYAKASASVPARSRKLMDLPPLPVVTGAPFAPAPDPNRPGALIVGSNFGPELFTTDPGRALITGDWADFEALDVPQLRGIAKTAPYFHDNSQVDLPALITTYSQFILPFLPQLDQFFPPVAPGTDRLTEQQRADLLTFLQVF